MRAKFGLTRRSRVQDWLSFIGPRKVPNENLACIAGLKCKDIPTLKSYRKVPNELRAENVLARAKNFS